MNFYLLDNYVLRVNVKSMLSLAEIMTFQLNMQSIA